MDNMMLPMVIAIAVVLAVVMAALFLLLVVGLLFMRRRGGAASGLALEEAMGGLGYNKVREGAWAKPIQGASMEFEKRDEGYRWTLQLPRYNTMTLQLVEASSGQSVEGPFEAGLPDLDERFVMGSSLAARIVPLLSQPKLRRALLRMPNLGLTLSADELVIEDPGGVGLAALGKDVDGELALHQLVANIVNTLFGVLYTEAGTVFDEYR